jgi:GNAT superfamily N-acetyltransferase
MAGPFEYTRLGPFDAPAYVAMTYPAFRRALLSSGHAGGRTLAVGATAQGELAGLALAEIDRAQHTAEVLSVFSAAPHRRRGLAQGLLERLERELRAEGVRTMRALYERGTEKAPAIEGLLDKAAFPKAAPYALLCRAQSDRLKEAPWMEKALLPSAFEMTAWGDVSADERRRIQERRETDLRYPEEVSPFREVGRVEPLNSLALRHGGEIVGWQVNHRIAPDTIRYTAMFVREDLQGYGLAIPLMVEAIRRHVRSGVPGLHRASFIVPFTAAGMVRFVNRRMAPYLDSVHESVETKKELAS